ncbi:MAG: serine/threonine-protein kinase [Anaerolineales bacterium]|nr:serine/threonine-protein kinase [Anaerolineales bacterium]
MVILARMGFSKNVGRYKIISELGRGGMGTVYRALDPRSHREVAVKVLPREMLHDLTFRARFEREIKNLVGLEHPNIVTVYDVGDEDGQPYFVMRYMKGGSLTDRIKAGKLSLQETAVVIEKVAKGLAYAHKKGLIHRDLKPDNILFDGENIPYISDFGIAKLSGSTGNLTDKSIGSPAYMSPEQARGEKLDARSDIYNLGAIIYHALSGKRPYNADTGIGVAVKHVTEPIPEILKELPSLPAEMDTVIKTAMAKDKERRYATPIELAKALNQIAFGYEGDFTPVKKAREVSLGKTGFAITGVILLIAIIGFFLLRNQLFSPALTVPQTSTPTHAPTSTTLPTKAPTQTATATPIPATENAAPSAIPFAPDCPAEIAIPTPVITEIDKFCVEKFFPYTTIAIPEGATFESLDPGFSCKAERARNGKSILSCTGKSSFSFDLKVCAPPSADLNKCPQNAAFDSANECCVTTLPPEGAGCVLRRIDIRACP